MGLISPVALHSVEGALSENSLFPALLLCLPGSSLQTMWSDSQPRTKGTGEAGGTQNKRPPLIYHAAFVNIAFSNETGKSFLCFQLSLCAWLSEVSNVDSCTVCNHWTSCTVSGPLCSSLTSTEGGFNGEEILQLCSLIALKLIEICLVMTWSIFPQYQ